MQRKNSILKHQSNRSGMALIMAIVVLVLLATIMAVSLSLSIQTTKRTTDVYLYEQAVLLSQSASEYAMLKISQSNPCSVKGSDIDFSYDTIYDINYTLRYIALSGSNCHINANVNTAVFSTTNTPESDGTVIMDITVSTKSNITTEPIRYFKRSIQKM